MAYSGREVERLVAKGVAALERTARATEKSAEATDRMLALATEEPVTIEPGPPVCPFCGSMNPVVHTQERAGSGPMAEMVIVLVCGECDMNFIAIPEGWITVTNIAEAEVIFEGRKGGQHGNVSEHRFGT